MSRSLSQHTLITICAISIAFALLLAACGGGGGSVTAPPQPHPTISSFTASGTVQKIGDSTLLHYAVTGADSITLNPPGTRLPADSGSLYVSPVVLVKYVLRAYKGSEQDSASVTIDVNPLPNIAFLAVTPSNPAPGDTSIISYRVYGADSARITPSGGASQTLPVGSLKVRPLHPTLYRLQAWNHAGSSRDSIQISYADYVPRIIDFTIGPDSIIQGDSALLAYHVTRADSVILTPTGTKTSTDSVIMWIAPDYSQTYQLRAFNQVGEDTAFVRCGVEYPSVVLAADGKLYRGATGTPQSVTTSFKVIDPGYHVLHLPWVKFAITGGGGSLSVDSCKVDSAGLATVTWTADSLSNHAVIEASCRTATKAVLNTRIDALAPGAGGQAQYMFLDDNYAMIKNYYGQPAAVYHDRDVTVTFLDYTEPWGLVPVLVDNNHNAAPNDAEAVLEVIVTGNYHGKTSKGIGIGSRYPAIVAAYGLPEALYKDTSFSPDVWVMDYSHIGMYLEGSIYDTSIVQMEMTMWLPTNNPVRARQLQELRAAHRPDILGR